MIENQENFSNLIPENDRDSKSYEELKMQVEKEVPDYEKFIPKNELVAEIPSIEKREEGIRYFNDEKLMERVKRVDLKRILAGERTITATPINKISFERELNELKKTAKFKAELYSLSENISYEQAYQKAKEEEVKKYQQRTKKQGGGYDIKSDEIKTYDKFRPENLKDSDEAIFPHEDMHAFFAQNCNYWQEFAKNERQLEDLFKEEQLLTLQEKKIERILENQNSKNELTNIFISKRELRQKKEILYEKVKIRPDILAVDEGFAYATTEEYANWNPDNFESYKDRTNPDLIQKTRDLSKKMISLVGIEATKQFVANLINEAHDKKIDAVKLLEEKVVNYIDNIDNKTA